MDTVINIILQIFLLLSYQQCYPTRNKKYQFSLMFVYNQLTK